MKAETKFTKRGTVDRLEVKASVPFPAQSGVIMLRFVVDKSNESLDVRMSIDECTDLIGQLMFRREESKEKGNSTHES